MKSVRSHFHCVCAAAAIFLAGAASSPAQTNAVPARITQAIDEHNLTVLSGNTHPLARPEFDRGPAPAALPMERMLLVLKRSPQQETALDTLLEQQQNGASPSYHHWLTPQQFGQQFGPADKDIQTITQWLQSHGFQAAGASNGRTTIEFSGTAGEVQEAFHTAIHQYQVNGQSYWANASDPQIPTALAPVVAGVNTLYNFPRQAMHETAGVFVRSKATGAVTPVNPQYTYPNPCNFSSGPICYFAVAPADFAKIYNVPNLALVPAPKTVYNGDGTTIAIVAESNINPQDFANFRSFFGLPAGNLNIILNGPDPGIIPGPETEADLDTQWAGAVAPNATIDLVVSESTETSLGPDLSAEYAIDNNLAPILSESFGLCEFYLGTAGNAFYSQLWQQAAAQGITVTISSGDQGSAVCDYGQTAASHGLSVNGFASTPYNIAVGGTDFNDLSNFSQFWDTAPSTSTTQPSALGYIPEMTWNDSCTNAEVPFALSLGNLTAEQTCNSALVQQYGLVTVTGGSGGKSNCTTSDGQNLTSCSGGYAKPAWQTSLTPHDSARDVPDISLFASNGFNGSFYIICELDQAQYAPPGALPCNPNTNSAFLGLGGTSASAPAFAGMMALINQATGSRQGNANYILYALAGKSGATCTSVASPASSCIFYDIPAGSTIAMPCQPSTPNCTVNTAGDQYGVLSGFSTSAGYDLATGLGSVNAANLISQWASFVLNLKPSTTALTLTPPSGGSLTTLVHGQSVTVSTNVSAGQGATGTPTGNVSLLANTGPNGQEGVQVQGLVLNNGSGSGTTNALPGGTYTVQAQYAGDGTFSSSTSSGTSVTVTPEASKATMAYELFDPVTGAQTNANATTAVFGTPSLLRVNVTSQAGDACAANAQGATGCPTGSINLTDSYNGGAAAPLDGGTFKLNSEGYTEDQAIDIPGGTHNLAASYVGDVSFDKSNASSLLTITPASTTVSLLAPTSGVTGQAASLTATISAQNIFSSIGPTGTVTFYSGTSVLGSGLVSGSMNQATHVAFGDVTITAALPHGQDSVTAQYSGDASYGPSASAAQTVDVNYPTSVAVTTSNPSVPFGTAVTFTAQVTTSQTGGPAITGTVQFLGYGVSSTPMALSNGQAQFTTSSLPGGMYTVQANYSGDSNYAQSRSGVSQTVTPLATTTVVASSNSSVPQGQSVTFTATVTPAQSGLPAVTGTVNFFSNGNFIGDASNMSSNQAQFTTSSLAVGSYQITAEYLGTPDYAASTSAAITQTVNTTPTFTVTANPTTITISSPGQSGSTMLTFRSLNGFSGSATLMPSMCSGLPSESSCGFSPSSITIPTNGTASTTLTIQTTAPSAAPPTATHRQNPGSWLGTGGEIALAFFLVGGLAALGVRGSQRRWAAAFALIALAFVFANAGCGGGSGGGITNPGTPAPSMSPVIVTITINGVTQTVPVTVSVQ